MWCKLGCQNLSRKVLVNKHLLKSLMFSCIINRKIAVLRGSKIRFCVSLTAKCAEHLSACDLSVCL